MDFNHLLFSPDGRIGRGPFWIGMAILLAASIVLSLFLADIFGMSHAAILFNVRTPAKALLDLIVNVILFWPGYVITVKRLHDRNRGAGLAKLVYILFFVAALMQVLGLDGPLENPSLAFMALSLVLLGLIAFLIVDLGFLRGDDGDNDYGAAPAADGSPASG